MKPYVIKRLFSIIIFIAAIQTVNGQDIIQTRKNRIILCKVVNVSALSIVYIADSNIVRDLPKDSITRFYVGSEVLYKKIMDNYPDWGAYYDADLLKADAFDLNAESNPSAELTVNISYWSGDRYAYNGRQNLRYAEIKHLLESNQEANKYVKKAKTNEVFFYMFSVVGGFCVGYPIGGAIAGKPVNESLLAAGVGSVLLSLPLYFGYSNNMKKAVEEYNKSVKK